MKRKKLSLFESVLITILAVIALGGLWLVLSPMQPAPHHNVSVNVPVMAPPVLPPVETVTPPVTEGGEKPEQLAMIVPVMPVVPPPSVGSSQHPVIALVIDDMGLDLRGSQRAVALPPYVTLSYIPYASNLRDQTREARDAGHELLLHMPMEPMGPDDPGPGWSACRRTIYAKGFRRLWQVSLALTA